MIKKFIGKHFLFIILLFIFLVTRAIIILNHPYFDFDEGAVALLGKLILNDNYRPLFFYNSQMGGGDAVLGYILAFSYWVFGISSFTARMTILFITCSFFIMIYAIMTRYFGKLRSLITLSLFLFSFSGWIYFNYAILRYMLGFLFHLVIVYFYYNVEYDNKQGPLFFVFFGLISGFGSYVFLPNLIITGIVLALLGFSKRSCFKTKITLGILFALFFLIGFSPEIYLLESSEGTSLFHYIDTSGNFEYFSLKDRTHNCIDFFQNKLPVYLNPFEIDLGYIKHQLSPKLYAPPNKLKNYETENVRALYQPQQRLNSSLLSQGYCYMVLFLILFVLVLNLRRAMSFMLGGLQSKAKKISPEVVFLLYFIVYSIIFCFYPEQSSLHISPVFYVIILLSGVGLSELWTNNGKLKSIFKSLSLIFFIIFLLLGINNVYSFINMPDKINGNYRIIEFLKQHSIENVYAPMQESPFFSFNGGDNMKSISRGIAGTYQDDYIHLDANKHFAVVLHSSEYNPAKFNDKLSFAFQIWLKKEKVLYEITTINNMDIYFNFSKRFSLEEYGETFLTDLTLDLKE